MPAFDTIHRLAPQESFDAGPSTVRPFISVKDAVGIAFGVSEFQAGSVKTKVLADEILFVLEGDVDLEGPVETHHLATGDALWMPRGSNVTFRTSAPCRLQYILVNPAAA